jgi:hypothetical protein
MPDLRWIVKDEQSGLLTHTGDRKRFIVHADEKLTAFMELKSATRRTIATTIE